MIISRTPFRISFFGGGTDYPEWYLSNGGTVLASAIDKYCWLFCRLLPPFFERALSPPCPPHRVIFEVSRRKARTRQRTGKVMRIGSKPGVLHAVSVEFIRFRDTARKSFRVI